MLPQGSVFPDKKPAPPPPPEGHNCSLCPQTTPSQARYSNVYPQTPPYQNRYSRSALKPLTLGLGTVNTVKFALS